MLRLLVTVLFVTLTNADISAQFYTAQNKVWAFGYGGGLDFNSGAPVYINTSINTLQACASVCDEAGNLRFFTNGRTVYNKTGATMPSGTAIVPFITHNSKQGALIMPVIGDTAKYYIFSLQEFLTSTGGGCRLAYSIVDMSLDGGLGDVVDTSAGTIFYDHLFEAMVAVPGNNNNIWLISHRIDTSMFVVFNITSTGVSDTVLEPYPGLPSICGIYTGILKASHNRRKLALAEHSCNGRPAIYDFDPNTGAITNEVSFDNSTGDMRTYGLEFSPDSKLLYVAKTPSVLTAYISQYNISLPDELAIEDSEIRITDSVEMGGGLRLGPDGKIYFPETSRRHLGCINAPNNIGLACNYVMHAVEKPNWLLYGLPPIYVTTDTTFSWTSPTTHLSNTSSETKISLFPNPASGDLKVSTSGMIFVVKLYNLGGQEVAEYTCIGSKEVTLNVEDLPSGVYQIQINGDSLHRFIKE
jgi:hypothetical protein